MDDDAGAQSVPGHRAALDFEPVESCPLCHLAGASAWSREDDETPAVRCDECGLVYLSRRLTQEAADRYYSRYNDARDEQNPALGELRRKMYDQDRRFVRLLASPGPLLDFGCGTGEFAAGLAGDLRPSGFDVDATAIGNAKLRWPELDFATELEDLSARHGPFTTVTLRGTLQYVRDLAAFAADIVRRLSPGGRVILLSIPNSDAPLAEILREKWVLHNRIEHLTIFNLATVGHLFQGFEIEFFDFPYIGTPYENHTADLARFMAVCRGEDPERPFPFWGSMMNVVLRKTS